VGGLSLFLCKLGSRRQLDYQLNTDGPEVLGNLNRLAGTAQDSRPSRPVNQTLEYFLEKIGSAPIAGLRQRMVQRLIRMKTLDAARLQGRFLVLIDGSGYLVSLFRCFGVLHRCFRRNLGGCYDLDRGGRHANFLRLSP